MKDQEPTPEDPADRTVFMLDDAGWVEFQEMLDRPARPNLRLAALFAEPVPWEDQS